MTQGPTNVMDDAKRWIHNFECQPPGCSGRYQEEIYQILTRIVERESRMHSLILQLMPEYYCVSKEPTAVMCPFHEEKTPSCCLDYKTSSFHCYGCNASGMIFPDGKLIRTDREPK